MRVDREPMMWMDAGAPNPEVVAKPTRHQCTAEYRLPTVEEANRCTQPGEVGRLLRREGLYTSHLSAWRKARCIGSLRSLTPNQRGSVTVCRTGGSSTVPARFRLVAAMSPCPRGGCDEEQGIRSCTAEQVAHYQARVA